MSLQTQFDLNWHLHVCSCLENVHIYYDITESNVYTCIYKYIAEIDAIGCVNVVEYSLNKPIRYCDIEGRLPNTIIVSSLGLQATCIAISMHNCRTVALRS